MVTLQAGGCTAGGEQRRMPAGVHEHHIAAARPAAGLGIADQAGEPLWDGTEMRDKDEQHYSQGPHAVVLCTYHRSKGLEWPVVILASLDAAPRADAFGVKIQSPATALDPEHPLDGRWIRYCPRPLAGRTRSFGFETSARARATRCC